jgi:glycosyltransferase involved in cell wall biosynthesis
MKKTALYFCHIPTSFTKIDTTILSKEFHVLAHEFSIGSAIGIPMLWFKQIVFLIKNINQSSLVFCMFAGYHSMLPVIFARLFNKPCIIVAGGIDAVSFPSVNYGNFNKFFLGKLTAYSFKWCSHIAPISDYLVDSPYVYQPNDYPRQGILFHVKNLKTPYTVVYNGFETEQWHDANITRKPNTFLSIASNLESESRRMIKGIDMVITAAKLFPAYTFTVIGSKGNSLQVEVPANLSIIPFIPHEQLREVYAQHDYYLQLSMSEGFGNTLAEAMLCGCIPIGANAGAIPFIINKNGFIVQQKDSNTLQAVIKSAVANTQKEELRKSARQFILDHFSIEKRSVELYKIIHALLK